MVFHTAAAIVAGSTERVMRLLIFLLQLQLLLLAHTATGAVVPTVATRAGPFVDAVMIRCAGRRRRRRRRVDHRR